MSAQEHPAAAAAEQAAEQAGQQAAQAGQTPAQANAQATQAAEQAAQAAAPELTDAQVEKIAKASSAATIADLEARGAFVDDPAPAVSSPPSPATQPAGDGSPPEQAAPPPAPQPATETPPATGDSGGEEQPERKSWARRFSGDRW